MDKDDQKGFPSRVFKSGNSQAVRIPAEVAFDSNDMDVIVTRRGDEIVISPKRKSVAEMFAFLRSLPEESKLGPVERTQTRETEWDR